MAKIDDMKSLVELLTIHAGDSSFQVPRNLRAAWGKLYKLYPSRIWDGNTGDETHDTIRNR